MNVNIGWPGKTHDARMFANSSVYTDMISGELFPNWTRRIGGVNVPLIILGDPAYPLLPWLIKPYIENSSSTPEQHTFNYRQSRARMVVENAFGRLKGRWRAYWIVNSAMSLIWFCPVLCCTIYVRELVITVVRSGLLKKRVFIHHFTHLHTHLQPNTQLYPYATTQ